MATNIYTVSFSGIAIETTVTDRASAIHEWVGKMKSLYNGYRIVVGLDCEWKPNTVSGLSNKIATLQLCVDSKCLIVQMLYLDYIPQSLQDFFSDPNVTFAGVDIGEDVMKMRTEYGRTFAKTADIQAMAKERWPSEFNQKPGLKDLLKKVVGLTMEKPNHVCTSNWEQRVLSSEQIEYACLDAYASYRVGNKLINGT